MKTSAKSIAEARGKNWGLPNAAASSVPVTRSIHIVCDSDHLAILPERRYGRDSKVIAFGEQTEDSVDELVSSVWERIDSWGIAGRGMYWRPTLTMEVEPGGQQRFADLKALLSGSGLDVKARPVVRTGPRYPRTKHPF